MATRFTPDDMANAIKDEHDGTDSRIVDEYTFWKYGSHGLALSAIPWGDDRNTQIAAAAAAKSITLTALSTTSGHWQREQQFWAAYADLV